MLKQSFKHKLMQFVNFYEFTLPKKYTYEEVCIHKLESLPVFRSADKVTRVPADVLCEAERQLSALRLSVFKLLQPTLKCEIGKMVQHLVIKPFDINLLLAICVE